MPGRLKKAPLGECAKVDDIVAPRGGRKFSTLLSLALIAGLGAAGLAFGTGAATVAPTVASSMAERQLSSAWWPDRPISADLHAGVHLINTAQTTPSGAPVEGDEGFWLGGATNSSGPQSLAIGSHLTLSAPGAHANGGVSSTYEIVEITPLAPASSLTPAAHPQATAPVGLTLVVCREVGGADAGSSPRMLRFLIEAQGPGAAATPTGPRAL